ncbi:hypothetical protein [Actinacidiphila glaucinigra]|uniref:hypothetical protein n=1 Tax=Actinacidiphila glaucinigra TaxID=235986 RepID=UPI003D903379
MVLAHGRRSHHGVGIDCLTEEQDPGVVLCNTIRDDLLPVFDAKPPSSATASARSLPLRPT